MVDHGATLCPLGVVRHRIAQALTRCLGSKGDDACRATHGCRPGRGFKRIGVHLSHAGHLFDMGVGIDAAGHHPKTVGIDQSVGAGGFEIFANRADLAVGNADIGIDNTLRRHQATAANDQIHFTQRQNSNQLFMGCSAEAAWQTSFI